MRLVQRLAQLIAPPVCILCGAPGQTLDEPWGLDLCIHCEAACPRAAPEPPPWQHAFCLFRYEDPVDLMIQRLKFQRDIAQARVLGTLFARAWRAAGWDRPECIVPLPLHRTRYVERGFCQTTLLARHIARRLGPGPAPVPVRTDLLQRVRATRAQSGLDAGERAGNLAGAFACAARRPLPRHVALLDDVLTTGHTAATAIGVLRAAGVARVDLWCCARALRLDGAVQPAPPPEQGREADPICYP